MIRNANNVRGTLPKFRDYKEKKILGARKVWSIRRNQGQVIKIMLGKIKSPLT